MNVCIIVNNLEIGGSERKIVKVANHLNLSGVKVTVLALKKGNDKFLRSELDECIDFYRFKFLTLLKFFIKNRYDNYLFLNGFPAIHIPLVRLVNFNANLIYLNNTSIIPAGFSKLRLALMRFSSLLSSSTVYGAINQKDLWEKTYNFPKNRGLSLHNGVDLNSFQPSNIYESSKVVMVGQIRKEKNYEEALKVLDILNKRGIKISLTIAGGGKGLPELKRRAVEYEVDDQIDFLGEVSDIHQILNESSIFLLCSNSTETFSNAALEAMAAGKVAILSDIGGAREMVRDKIDGFIYKSGDLEALAAILIELQNEKLLKQISINARKRVENMFSSDKMMKAYVEMLK